MTTFNAKMKTGESAFIVAEDKGESVPGYQEHDGVATRFEAFTTHFRCDKFERLEMFVQVDKRSAVESGNILAFRLRADQAALEAEGVDLSTMWLVE